MLRRPGGLLHQPGGHGLEGQRDRHCQRADHVEPEHLQGSDRQGGAEHGPQQDRHRCAAIDRQHESEGLAQVEVDRAALFHRPFNRGEVVVGEQHVCGLARHFGAAGAHGDADVGLLEGGRVVDAVAGHCHDLTVGLEGLHQLQFLGRRHPGKYVYPIDTLGDAIRPEFG